MDDETQALRDEVATLRAEVECLRGLLNPPMGGGVYYPVPFCTCGSTSAGCPAHPRSQPVITWMSPQNTCTTTFAWFPG